jgi:hypothetical protein
MEFALVLPPFAVLGSLQFRARRLSKIIVTPKVASDATSAPVALVAGFGALQLQPEPLPGGVAGVPASGAPASGGSPHDAVPGASVQRPIL